MKQLLSLLLIAVIAASVLAGCGGDDATPADPNATAGNITIDTIRLSAQGNTVYNNLYDADRDTSYRIQFYATRKSEIEFLYFYDAADKSVLASPDLPRLTSVMNYSGYISGATMAGAHSSGLKKLSYSAAQFNALKDSAQLKAAYFSSNSADAQVTDLGVDDVVAFVTSEGRTGVLKVASIDGSGGAGSVTLAVKIER